MSATVVCACGTTYTTDDPRILACPNENCDADTGPAGECPDTVPVAWDLGGTE